MAFTIPTRQELHDAFVAAYALALPEQNVSRGSDPYRLGRVLSGWLWNGVARLLYFVKQMLPDTAEKEFLERWGAVYNFPRRAATKSSKKLSLRVTGTVAASVPVDSELVHEDGTLYKVTSVGAIIGGGGSVDVDVESISTGQQTNKVIGELLTFTSPPPSVDAQATLVLDLEGGLDIETYDEYRVRLLAHIGDPPSGGAVHDYIEWATVNAGVKSAYVWTHRRGFGTVDIAILGYGTGAARVPVAQVITDVDQYIEEQRPGNVRDFQILTTTTQTQNVETKITIDETKYKWDWTDDGVGYAITADSSGASTITVPTAPTTVVPGVRLTVRGEEARVTARVGNVLTLSFENNFDNQVVTWFTFTPTGQNIRASGDLVKPVRNAIFALYNTLGPARSTYSRTSWISELKISKLFAAITDVDGVDDATLQTPTVTVVPVDDFNESFTIPFLIPGDVKVYKQ